MKEDDYFGYDGGICAEASYVDKSIEPSLLHDASGNNSSPPQEHLLVTEILQ